MVCTSGNVADASTEVLVIVSSIEDPMSALAEGPASLESTVAVVSICCGAALALIELEIQSSKSVAVGGPAVVRLDIPSSAKLVVRAAISVVLETASIWVGAAVISSVDETEASSTEDTAGDMMLDETSAVELASRSTGVMAETIDGSATVEVILPTSVDAGNTSGVSLVLIGSSVDMSTWDAKVMVGDDSSISEVEPAETDTKGDGLEVI